VPNPQPKPKPKPKQPWWANKESDMAFQAWMQKQDRTGEELGPAVPVPAGATGFTVRLNDLGFISPAQTVEVVAEVSFNGGQTWQGAGGSPTWLGGVKNKGKDGSDLPWDFTGGWPPAGPTPTHARVTTRVAGVVNCGVDVEFAGV